MLFLALLIVPGVCSGAEKSAIVKGELAVVFEEPARGLAEEVAAAYPVLKAELEETFGRRADFGPGVTVALLTEDEFGELAGSAPVVAYASSRDNSIVMGVSRAERDADTFVSILKHELAHLYLASYIEHDSLPRWLNEGVCQWASGGISELLSIGRSTEIERATLLGRLIPLDALGRGFPHDDKQLRLAYQQSLSFVEFVVAEHGREALIEVLDAMSKGSDVREAFRAGTGVELSELEISWHERLRVRHTLLTYLSNNIYTLLFVLAALVTVYGFIRLILRMRAYRDEDEEEFGPH
jgi:hypothetical protein